MITKIVNGVFPFTGQYKVFFCVSYIEYLRTMLSELTFTTCRFLRVLKSRVELRCSQQNLMQILSDRVAT